MFIIGIGLALGTILLSMFVFYSYTSPGGDIFDLVVTIYFIVVSLYCYTSAQLLG